MVFSIFLPGCEKPEKIERLLKLTRFKSEDVVLALTEHLIKGSSPSMAAASFRVDDSNFRRALKKLEDTAQLVEEIKDIDWPDYQMTRFKKVS